LEPAQFNLILDKLLLGIAVNAASEKFGKRSRHVLRNLAEGLTGGILGILLGAAFDAPPSCSFATIRRPKTEKPRAKPDIPQQRFGDLAEARLDRSKNSPLRSALSGRIYLGRERTTFSGKTT
jgi:hypothetical protein